VAQFVKRGWVKAYSHWLEDNILLIRDESISPPQKEVLSGVVYTVPELIKLSHYDRSWETARRIHLTKKFFNAAIV
jgi:hypothetical protein